MRWTQAQCCSLTRLACKKRQPEQRKNVDIRLAIKDLVRSRYRQLEIKTRSMRVVRRGPELTAVGFNDRPANRKSHPHPAILRRKKGIKDAVHVGRIDPR